jgi:hypothetical protein
MSGAAALGVAWATHPCCQSLQLWPMHCCCCCCCCSLQCQQQLQRLQPGACQHGRLLQTDAAIVAGVAQMGSQLCALAAEVHVQQHVEAQAGPCKGQSGLQQTQHQLTRECVLCGAQRSCHHTCKQAKCLGKRCTAWPLTCSGAAAATAASDKGCLVCSTPSQHGLSFTRSAAFCSFICTSTAVIGRLKPCKQRCSTRKSESKRRAAATASQRCSNRVCGCNDRRCRRTRLQRTQAINQCNAVNVQSA